MGVYLEKTMTDLGSTPFTNVPVRFKAGTDLNLIGKTIEDRILMYGLPELKDSDKDSQCEPTTLISDAIRALPETQKDIEKLILDLSTVITRSFEHLKNVIAPEVEELSNEITKTADLDSGISQEDGVPQLDVETMNLKVINLADKISSIGELYQIREVVHKHFDITDLNMSVRHAIMMWNSLQEFTWATSQHLQFFREQFTVQVLEELGNATPSEADIQSMHDRLTRVTQLRVYGPVLSKDHLTYGLYTVDSALDLFGAIDSAMEIVPEHYRAEFVRWNYLTKLVVDVAAYALGCIHTLTPFGESLMYTDTLVNSQVLEEFESQGGTLVELQQILRVFYSTNPRDMMNKRYGHNGYPIPAHGLTLEKALDSLPATREYVTNTNSALASMYVVNRKAALCKAMGSVLNSFTETFSEPLAPYDNLEIMRRELQHVTIPAYVAMFRSSDKEALEHFLYLFILRLRYPDDIMETIYRNLGSSYSDLVDRGADFDDSNVILYADITVMAQLLASFLAEHMVEPV